MSFSEFLKNNIVYLDGGMGTLLQANGLKPGEHPESWNVTHSDVITKIHKDYFDAGSNVVCTNTFGANALKFDDNELELIIKSAIKNANDARAQSKNRNEKFIALDIGPSGRLLSPLGDLDFEDAVAIFSKTVRLGVKYGVDAIVIETMNDCYETKAAVIAAKENSNVPIIVTNAYGQDAKLMTGASPLAMVTMLEGLGVCALGANCSYGPKQLKNVVSELLKYASVPVVLKPNAGLPKVVDKKTVFDIEPAEFANDIKELIDAGVRVVGGCCGTTPEYIDALFKATCKMSPKPIVRKEFTAVSSYTHAVVFDTDPILIGERINPTGKKRFKQALLENDIEYILTEGVNQAQKGVHILDVNVGLPDIDERQMLTDAVCRLQEVTNLPLQIDTADISAMESAIRRYNGKPMINSVNGKQQSMREVFPLVKKYGGVVVALTLDEDGIPSDACGRIEIAKKILKTAKEYGIDKKDIIFDPLALTISADAGAASATLEAVNIIRTQLLCHTSLGVSNVSFGLPNRDAINSAFFTMALTKGLSAAIMNPYSDEMLKSYYTYRALCGIDSNCSDYISVADSFLTVTSTACQKTETEYGSELMRAVIKGFKDSADSITKQMLLTTAPLDIVNGHIIPALDTVGRGFENKTVYLPQLLMSAEAAKSAFLNIKEFMSKTKSQKNDGVFVIATVQGDIHDIGKNIVKLLLENYGFDVIDLGKDVPPEAVVDAVIENKAQFAGLSALMTTTVPAMQKTVELLKKKAPLCKTVVGGAVLTQEYADKIGADKYAKDAMETVRYAKEVIEK